MNTTSTKKKNIIGLKELRENMETYIERVQNGESLTVVRRSEPVFRISPADIEDKEDIKDEGWDTVLDFTKIRKGGVPLDEVITTLRKMQTE